MDKNAIKKYAVWARRELISRVTQKALQYGITEKEMQPADASSVNGVVLSAKEKKQRQALIAKINDEGFEQVMEEVAYTWFNRFSALRFMEVNGYLPTHVRVFTDEENNFKPQILAEAINLEIEGLDMEKVYALKDANDNDTLFKYLIITQCNALSSILPGMFQKIDDYTELLFPDNLLREGSAIEQMIAMIPEEDWQDAVQIIGWLYQYYNAEKKDDVFAALKKNVKITKENIPAATQLFTPDWIVRYMVENSLGRLWLEGHPNEELKSGWKYYLDEAEQEPEVQTQLAKIRKEYEGLKPEDIRCIDPCSGSGHILAYLFDVLVQIYETYGYTAREAAASIVENNLYGLDIDERAAQLANFAVMMKARQYDRRFFSREIQPKVYVIAESNHVDKYNIDYFANGDAGLKKAITTVIDELHDAKEYGSILTVTPQDWTAIYARFEEIREDINISREATLNELLPLVDVSRALAQKYDVVVTNPPYMGASGMNAKLGEFIKKNYADYKSDFFSAFVIHCSKMTKKSGYCGFFTPYVWMFIQSYEKMRNYLYNQATIETLIQFEYSAFEEATVPVCTFAFQNRQVHKKGCYLRLVDFRGGMEVQRQKTLEAIDNHECGFYYERSTDDFSKIPGSPVAYWVSGRAISAFENSKSLGKLEMVRGGLTTGDNNRFLRLWFEVNHSTISFETESIIKAGTSTSKWFPIAKGGEYRKWYGNQEYVVNWENDGAEIKYWVTHNPKDPNTTHWSRRLFNTECYFKEIITWSGISSGNPSMRFCNNAIFGSGAKAIIPQENLDFYLAFLNSAVALMYLDVLSPTLNYESGHISSLPIKIEKIDSVTKLVLNCVVVSCHDWDSSETSWDFLRHPLVRGASVADAFSIWTAECNDRFNTLKANEEELNRIFIDIYGLQDELTPEVEDKDVTVRKADLQRDIKSLISYAVGCMFGRYSLDIPGLAFAGGDWDSSKYPSFPADKDNIIPICNDGDYFEDDIVGRFVKFLEAVYGKDTLDANLKFIADALGGKGQPKDIIRNYFLNDFYNDHCKIYQKRPIYWQFDSGKKNGFKCLIYMHRYQPDTIARIRTDYVHEQQGRYRTAIADLEKRMEGVSTSDRVKLSKQLATLQAQAAEIHDYEEKIHHLADQYISIGLDDGVKVNYAKFQDVLAKIK